LTILDESTSPAGKAAEAACTRRRREEHPETERNGGGQIYGRGGIKKTNNYETNPTDALESAIYDFGFAKTKPILPEQIQGSGPKRKAGA
jgi:hypothetical protein